MTLPEAEALFAQYVPNGTSNFTAECNDLLRRFFDSGKWNGLVTEYETSYPAATSGDPVVTETGNIVVAGAGTAAANGTYKYVGDTAGKPFYIKETDPLYAIRFLSSVPDSYWQIIYNPTSATPFSSLYNSVYSALTVTPDLCVTWTAGTGSTPVPTVTAETETAYPDARDAGVIVLPDTYESVLAAQFDGNPVTLFSSYHEFQQGGPGEIEEGFSAVAGLVDNGDRTYKIVGGADYDEIRLKVKRRFVPLSADTDVLPIDNPAALKLGFMSLNYESNGQLELADQYFARALATLNGELKEARGGVQGVMQPSPHGFWPTNSKRGY